MIDKILVFWGSIDLANKSLLGLVVMITTFILSFIIAIIIREIYFLFMLVVCQNFHRKHFGKIPHSSWEYCNKCGRYWDACLIWGTEGYFWVRNPKGSIPEQIQHGTPKYTIN